MDENGRIGNMEVGKERREGEERGQGRGRVEEEERI